MGVERSVTRWYVQRQLIWNEVDQLEAQLAHFSAGEAADPQVARENATELQQQLAKAQEKLHLLGACPRPMMG